MDSSGPGCVEGIVGSLRNTLRSLIISPLMMRAISALLFTVPLVIMPTLARAESDASQAFLCKSALERTALESKLQEAQRAYRGIGSFRARFEQDSFLAALDAQEVSVGTVLFKKPGMMQWQYESPERQTFTLRDKTVWLYQPQVKQVMIDQLSAVILSELPVSFLMGLGDLGRDFELTQGCQTASGTVLVLVPKDKESKTPDQGLKSFKLLLAKKDAFPIGAKIADVAGNVTTLLFKSIDQNPHMSEKDFVARYPEGTDINDRRRKS
jgi:outer membrane lipoprotein carrier protein